MADTLAEIVQLQRAEEQANPESGAGKARLRWDFRLAERTVVRGRAEPLKFIGVRLPRPLYDALASHGMPAVVARQIIAQWAMRVAKRTE
jgi:hypothetical protein